MPEASNSGEHLATVTPHPAEGCFARAIEARLHFAR